MAFRNILVGVDLSRGDWRASVDGESGSRLACEQAIHLAAASVQAGREPPQLHFLAALDLPERTKTLLENADADESVIEQSQSALKHYVNAAMKAGVDADSSVVLGASRIELVQRATDGKHDLVMVGSREHGLLAGVIMGSTAIELLRKASCPVWVAKPSPHDTPQRLLIATDFSPVCDALFDQGVQLASILEAELHVIHVVSPPQQPYFQFSQAAEDAIKQAHDEDLAAAREKLDDLLKRPQVAELPRPVETHLEVGSASNEIATQCKDLQIDLLLMGTVAWGGIPGMLIGSTAQKMLPVLTCSLLSRRPEEAEQTG